MMSVGLTGCANTDIFSGDVYEAGQAKRSGVQLAMVLLFLFVLLKIQADNPGVIGYSWWWCFRWYRR